MRLAPIFLSLTVACTAFAQTHSVQRTVVAKGDISVSGREAIVVLVSIAPNGAIGRHTHHGDEIGYLQEGEVEMQVDGEAPRMLKAKDAFIIQAGKVHEARNIGNGPASLVVTYVVEKEKPLAVPAK